MILERFRAIDNHRIGFWVLEGWQWPWVKGYYERYNLSKDLLALKTPAKEIRIIAPYALASWEE
jgi:hypothetical protein